MTVFPVVFFKKKNVPLEKCVLIKLFILQIVVFFMGWTTQFYS